MEALPPTIAVQHEKPPASEKAHCPTCHRSQNCDVHGRVHKPWEWSDRHGNSTSGGVTYTLFECRGCNTVFHEISSWDDSDLDYWYRPDGEAECEANLTKETFPKPSGRPHPDWFDISGPISPMLHRILAETYKADEAGCHLLAAVGLRTALDSCFEAVGVDSAGTFGTKLATLKTGGHIGDAEYDLLTVLIDAGSAAAHRGWAPEQGQVHQLMDVLENFIQRVLINGKRALEIKAGIPQRQRRSKPTNNAVGLEAGGSE